MSGASLVLRRDGLEERVDVHDEMPLTLDRFRAEEVDTLVLDYNLSDIRAVLLSATVLSVDDVIKYAAIHRDSEGEVTHRDLRPLARKMSLPSSSRPVVQPVEKINGVQGPRSESNVRCIPGCSACCYFSRDKKGDTILRMNRKDYIAARDALPGIELADPHTLNNSVPLSNRVRSLHYRVPVREEGGNNVSCAGLTVSPSGTGHMLNQAQWQTLVDAERQRTPPEQRDVFDKAAYPSEGYEGRQCSLYPVRPTICRNYACSVADRVLPDVLEREGHGVIVRLLELPTVRDRVNYVNALWRRGSLNERMRYLEQIGVLPQKLTRQHKPTYH